MCGECSQEMIVWAHKGAADCPADRCTGLAHRFLAQLLAQAAALCPRLDRLLIDDALPQPAMYSISLLSQLRVLELSKWKLECGTQADLAESGLLRCLWKLKVRLPLLCMTHAGHIMVGRWARGLHGLQWLISLLFVNARDASNWLLGESALNLQDAASCMIPLLLA